MKALIFFFLTLSLTFTSASQTYEIDTEYDVGVAFDDETEDLVKDNDGKVIVSGFFSNFKGTTRHKIARLNIDGTLDGTFDAGTTFETSNITALAYDPINDKVYVAGTFAESVIRLNNDGTVDNSFTFDDSDFDGAIISMAVDSGGGLLAGQGTGTSGVSAHFGRYNTDGSKDNTFNDADASGKFTTAISSSTKINHISIDDNGKILVVGNFVSFGNGEEGVVRLNADGTVDNTFNLNYLQEVDNSEKFFGLTLDNGQVLVSGLFTTGTRIERFNSDGSADSDYSAVTTLGGGLRPTNQIAVDDDGDYIIGGLYGLRIKKSADGSDVNIQAGDGFLTSNQFALPEIEGFVVDAEGGIIAIGNFNYYNGSSQGFMVRLEECNSIEITQNLESSTSACETEDVSLIVSASGTSLSYQWQLKSSDDYGSTFSDLADDATYSGSSTNTLTITGVNSSMNNHDFRCIVSDADCNVTSVATNLNVFSGQTITTQPVDQNVCVDNDASFTLVVDGSTSDIQWQVNDGNGFEDLTNGDGISGATGLTLTISDVSEEMDGFTYQAVLSTCSTPISSDEVTLSVTSLPVITEETQRPQVCVSGDATFTAVAAGEGTLTYQWQYRVQAGSPVIYADLLDDPKISGSTSSTLTFTDVDNTFDKAYLTESNGSVYVQLRCKVSLNGCETFTTASKLLEIHVEPSVTEQPTAEEGLCDNGSGVNTSFSFQSSAGVPYQWQVNDGTGFVDLEDNDLYSNTNSTNLDITGATSDMDGYEYRCELGTCTTPVYTDVVTLSVGAVPTITTQPVQVDVCEGLDVEYSVEASGSNLVYQWQERVQGGSFVDLSDQGKYFGSGSSVLQISDVSTDMDNNSYRCIITDGECSATSSNRILNVFDSPSFSGTLADRTVCEGSDVSFSKSASNFFNNVHTYQWQESLAGTEVFADIEDGEKFSGTNSSILGITSATISMEGNRYRLKIIGCGSDVFSDDAVLTVNQLPIITESPVSQTTCVGEDVTFSTAAIGTDLTYQWNVKTVGSNTFQTISSEDSGLLTLENVDISLNGAVYKCVILPASPCETSSQAIETPEVTLTVNQVEINSQPPATVESCIGYTVPISLTASGEQLEYQWLENGEEISDGEAFSGTTTATLVINLTTESMNGNSYSCMISGLCDPVESSGTRLSLSIIQKPVIEAIISGGQTLLRPVSDANSYEWFLDGQLISTNFEIVAEQEGEYTVVGISNECMSETSDPYIFSALGIAHLSDVSIYPNPTAGYLKLEFKREVSIKLFGLNGKEIFDSSNENRIHMLDLSNEAEGQYVLHVYDKNRLLGIEKIIKSN